MTEKASVLPAESRARKAAAEASPSVDDDRRAMMVVVG